MMTEDGASNNIKFRCGMLKWKSTKKMMPQFVVTAVASISVPFIMINLITHFNQC
jgi:hypothetical protein